MNTTQNMHNSPFGRQSIGTSKNKKNLFFSVGVFLTITTVGLSIWAFAIGDLTPHQTEILRIFLAITSGFACGSFYGAIKVESAKFLNIIAVSATGGFAVWFLTLFFTFNENVEFFEVKVIIENNDGQIIDTLNNYELVLIANEKIESKIENGNCLISNIPMKYYGDSIRFNVLPKISGYRFSKNYIILKNDYPIFLQLAKE